MDVPWRTYSSDYLEYLESSSEACCNAFVGVDPGHQEKLLKLAEQTERPDKEDKRPVGDWKDTPMSIVSRGAAGHLS